MQEFFEQMTFTLTESPSATRNEMLVFDIWSEDYPYLSDVDLRFFLEKSDLTSDQKYAIARGNAEKLFGLK